MIENALYSVNDEYVGSAKESPIIFTIDEIHKSVGLPDIYGPDEIVIGFSELPTFYRYSSDVPVVKVGATLETDGGNIEVSKDLYAYADIVNPTLSRPLNIHSSNILDKILLLKKYINSPEDGVLEYAYSVSSESYSFITGAYASLVISYHEGKSEYDSALSVPILRSENRDAIVDVVTNSEHAVDDSYYFEKVFSSIEDSYLRKPEYDNVFRSISTISIFNKKNDTYVKRRGYGQYIDEYVEHIPPIFFMFDVIAKHSFNSRLINFSVYSNYKKNSEDILHDIDIAINELSKDGVYITSDEMIDAVERMISAEYTINWELDTAIREIMMIRGEYD